MPIIPAPKNPITVLREARALVSQRTNLTNFEADSKIRSILDAFEREAINQRQEKIIAFESLDLTRADLNSLRKEGAARGVTYLDSAFASTSESELNFVFYVESGTFGDINGASDITIPAGQTVYSPPNNNEFGTRVEFVTTQGYTLPAAASLYYCSIRATSPGAASNVGRGLITSHTFTNYTGSGTGSLKCINFYPILNGRDAESVEQYRYRLSRHYVQLGLSNTSKLELLGLEVPGVREIRVVPNYYGIGTAGVFVLGVEYQSSPALIRAVQDRIDSVATPGRNAVATAATENTLSMELTLRTAGRLTENQASNLNAQIRRAASSYLRNVGLGGLISFNELKNAITRNTNGVVRFGKTTDSSIDKIFLERSASNSMPYNRVQVVADYKQLEDDAYVVLGNLDIRII